jgi:hypothetical protein
MTARKGDKRFKTGYGRDFGADFDFEIEKGIVEKRSLRLRQLSP